MLQTRSEIVYGLKARDGCSRGSQQENFISCFTTEFRRCALADATFGPGMKLTVKVRQPEMCHTVSVARLRSWLDGVGKSPNEHAMKSRLRGSA